MHHIVAFSRFQLVLGLTAISLALPVDTVSAAEVPWQKSRFQYVALKKDLRELLREFAANHGLTVEIAEGVEGSVSGSFDLPPQATLDLLAANHHFSWHYDGTMLYVAPVKRTEEAGIRLRADSGDQLHIRLSRSGASEDKAGATPPGIRYAPAHTAGHSENGGQASRKWDIDSADRTLSTAMARWSAEAGWQLLWELPVDYEIDARTSISGTFPEAVEAVAKSMAQTDVPMKAIFYAGNKVLRIVAREAL